VFTTCVELRSKSNSGTQVAEGRHGGLPRGGGVSAEPRSINRYLLGAQEGKGFRKGNRLGCKEGVSMGRRATSHF
jgi:hypothetical protein